VHARQVINAAGPRADAVRRLLGQDGKDLVRTTRGSHLVLPPRPTDRALAAFLPDGRIQFVIPHTDGTICGTTDVDHRDGLAREAAITRPELDYLLAALRAQVEPVSTRAYARFLPAWQQVGASGATGVDGLLSVIEQLAGAAVPASAVEPLIFSPRVPGYQPAMLDELLASGEVIWSGAGAISGSDGWVVFHHADTAPLTLAAPAELPNTDHDSAVVPSVTLTTD
jgi:hypothetical protein